MSGLISEIFEKSKSSCANTEGSRLWKLRGQNENDFRQLKLSTNFCIAETFSKFTYLLSYQLIQY